MKLARILTAVLISSLALRAGEGLKFDMTNYIVGYLRKGPNSGTGDQAEAQKLQEGHMANIRRMAAAGKLVVAGPFSDNGDLRGMFIFAHTTMEEAKALVAA